MALYQPTNVIPSSYTKGTVDVNDIMEISWQVNGNSAMTAFQIDFYLNDYASTPVTSTGRLTDNIPTDGFYGTDRFGRPQFFTWSAGEPWNVFDGSFTNGNEYKYKITQWYSSSTIYTASIQQKIVTNPYFEIDDGLAYICAFDFNRAVSEIGKIPTYYFFFDKERQIAWYYIDSISSGKTYVNFSYSQVIPPDGTDLGMPTLLDDDYIVQLSASDFITRTTPTISLFTTKSDYTTDKTALSTDATLSTSIGYFVADYVQEQGDPIRWVRWQVATATRNIDDTYSIGEIIADTGEINTPTLNYEYNGFFNEQFYAIRCLGESQSGQETTSQNTDENDWIFFKIDIVNQGEYRGDFTMQCLSKENAALLEWSSEELRPTVQGEYVLNNGSITLQEQSKLTWTKSNTFLTPWIAAFNISLQTTRSYIMQGRGVEIVQTFTSQGLINSVTVQKGGNVRDYSTSISEDQRSCTVTLFPLIPSRTSYANIILNTTPTNPIGQLAAIQSANEDLIFTSILDSNTPKYSITLNNTPIEIPQNTNNLVLLVAPTSLIGYSNGVRFLNQSYSYSQSTINSIQISGGINGATFNCVTLYKGNLDIGLLDELYSSTTFKPTWTSPNYSLYMTANFIGNIDGGTVAAFRIYRQELGKNVLTPIFYSEGNILKLKDYGIVSRKVYTYWLYEYDTNNAFLKGAQCTLKNDPASHNIATCFKNYSLLVCDYDETNDEYHVRKQYLFALNPTESGVGNNNSPTLNANFTRYPTRMPSTQNYASGTLQGLIGVIYTVPALIEQIGNYKWTTKPSTMDYFDNVDLEKELYDLSTAPYQLFLRDMKGRLRMIHTNGPITMTTNIKQKQQSISMSLPWVEIGDASDVTIIQTPDDYGWNNDNQVLDVQLDMDVATGELSATYPFPYNGTRFYLTGVNKETLAAKTPLGITPAQFELSETATQPDDGEVTATVKVNSENDN